MLKQGIAKTLVKKLSDDNMEERQDASDLVTRLAPYCELVAL
jgi:DNA gyrase/topoisomerase IV subunit A